MLISSYQFQYLLIIFFICYIQIKHSFLSYKTAYIINNHINIHKNINSLHATTNNDNSRSSYSYSNVLNWYEINECSVLIPSQERIPKAIIHFIGGFLAGSSIQIGYSSILSELCSNGYLIIATPIPPVELDHMKVSNLASQLFLTCYSKSIRPILGNAADDVPIIGLSHSLGGKLTALIHSNLSLRKVLPKRYANIYLAFNNYGIQESMKTSTIQQSPEVKKIIKAVQSNSNIQNFVQNVINNDIFKSSSTTNTMSSVANDFMNSFNKLNTETNNKVNDNKNNNNINKNYPMQTSITDQLSNYIKSNTKDFSKDKFSLEFNPSPIETWQMIQKSYNVNKNYVFKFANDDIDQSVELSEWLNKRGCEVKLTNLPGNHLTPNAIIIPSTITSSPFFTSNNNGNMNSNNAINSIIDDNISKETQLRIQEEQKIALDFIKELIKQLNIISNNAWDDIITNNQQKYNLPYSSNSNNKSSSGSNSADNSDGDQSKKWDSDNY